MFKLSRYLVWNLYLERDFLLIFILIERDLDFFFRWNKDVSGLDWDRKMNFIVRLLEVMLVFVVIFFIIVFRGDFLDILYCNICFNIIGK